MKLYTFPASPNSLKVTATAALLGIQMEQVIVDLGKREQLKPEFVALNPNSKIPTLVDGDFVLWESAAIMLYLAEKSGKGLLPSDFHERMQMHQWIAWELSHMGPACGTLLFERFVKGLFKLGEPDANAIAQGETNFHRFAKVLNLHLKGRDYVVGKALSLADYHIAAPFVHTRIAKYPLEEYAEIRRWSDAILGSEAWRKALADLK